MVLERAGLVERKAVALPWRDIAARRAPRVREIVHYGVRGAIIVGPGNRAAFSNGDLRRREHHIAYIYVAAFGNAGIILARLA